MSTSPQGRVIERTEQPYVSISGQITTETLGEIADRLPDVLGWLRAGGVEPQAALTVRAGVSGAHDGAVRPTDDATVSHVGHADELCGVTASLLDRAAAEGPWRDGSEPDDGQVWACRVELFRIDAPLSRT